MAEFHPGPGWREFSDVVTARIDTSIDRLMYWHKGKWRYWVREEPADG